MSDSTKAHGPNPPPDPADPAASEASSDPSPSPGWYPDPNAGGANLMRYWDGDAWTDRVQNSSEVNATRRTADERKVILAQQPAILTIFTCLLWGIVWAIIAATGGEKREMVMVDDFGNVLSQKLGKS